MATLASGARVPLEIISLIISNFYDRKNLINTCLVSQTWYRLAFPRLWREVHLENSASVGQFVTRLEADDENSIFCIGPHVRLLFVHPISKFFDGDGAFVTRFQEVAPKLVFLEHLSRRTYIAKDVAILQALRESCSILRSVDITHFGDWRGTDDRESKIHDFKNMTHISLGTSLDYGNISDSSPMIRMINDSPNLVTLRIQIPHIDPDWLDRLFGSLNSNFPALRTLEVQSATFDLEFETGASIGLCSFFERHPELRAVAFDWPVSPRIHSATGQDGLGSSPDNLFSVSSRGKYTFPQSYLDFERLFPSLESFAGHVLDCAAVVKSPRLAGQLVELEVRTGRGPSIDYSLGIESLAQVTSSLPKLRRFEHSGYYNKHAASARDKGNLAQIVAACPELNFLKLPSSLKNLSEHLVPLSRAQRVTTFEFDMGYIDGSIYDDDEHPGLLDSFVPEAKKACPGLRHLKAYISLHPPRIWEW
ncbi:hypothetical protein BDV93DRAFT_607935 [Ceratobasidium sp. AG-I]|nr:hypothetical protein BDV93DRAFT_607935 [Ceratobasidium sp. AG-I]